MFRFCSFSKEGYLPHLPSSVGFLLSLKKVSGPHTLTEVKVFSCVVQDDGVGSFLSQLGYS